MFSNTFLHSFDKDPMFASSFIVQHVPIIMSISQIYETLFILTIPFFLSRYVQERNDDQYCGVDPAFCAVCLRWRPDSASRYVLLVPSSMIVYGCAFDFFNISGFVFVEKKLARQSASARDVPDDD